jgi:hypothetical protein
MDYEKIGTNFIDAEALPWVPFTPYSEDVHIKLIKADPIRGEMIVLMKAPVAMVLPKHVHTGTVIVYTINGAWKYVEHDWVATPGSVVFETAASEHTAVGVPGHGDEVIALNILVGDLIYKDGNGQIVAMENWRTMVERYLAWCRANGVPPRDVTSFAEA